MIVVFYESESLYRGRVYSVNMQGEMLSEEVRSKGIEVESVEDPVFQSGKYPVQYINPSTKEMWYEYVERELTPEEKIAQLEMENSFFVLEMLKAQEQAKSAEQANADLTLELITKGVI